MPRRQIAAGRSCLECRRRKIKCDRGVPCQYCVRCEIRCLYPPGPRQTQGNGNATEGIVASRLQTLEASYTGLEQELSQMKKRLDGTEAREGQVPLSHPGYNISDPFEHIQSLERRATRTKILFPFTVRGPVNLAHLHPSTQRIPVIWQIYLDVVDPVLKLFHIPTTQRQILRVSQNWSRVDSSLESVLFAVYYASATALPATECQNQLGQAKDELLERYRTGVETALSQANFLTSQELTVLQAFTLYITCSRRDPHGPDSHTLIGLAIGVALKMGLHDEESQLCLSAFERELRRRLWWQIRTLDVRIAEDYHREPTIIESVANTALPTNTNDINLDPDMSAPPLHQQCRTETLYSLVRFQGSHFAARMVFSDAFCSKNGYEILSVAEKCTRIDQFWDNFEKGILSYCDKDIPIDFVTITSIRLVIVKLKLAVCKPRVGEELDIRMGASYRATCEEVLRHALALRQYEKGQQFLWLFQTYLEWDALAYLLLDLCRTPGEAMQATWAVMDEVYEFWKASPDVRRDERWEHIEELRQEALTRRGQGRRVLPSQPTVSSTSNLHGNTSLADVPTSTSSWVPESSAYMMQLPTDGTLPEWDAALLEHYWHIAG